MKTRTLFTRFALLIGATSLLFGCNFGGGNISINPPSSSESSSSSEDSSSSDSSSSVEDSSSDSSSVSSSSTLPVISLEDGDVMIESMKFKNEFYKVNAGKSVLISPNVLPINATYQDFYWESENTEVATVNQRGYVHGESSGESYVTAYALDGSGLTATTKIVVYETEITSISLSIDNKNCSVGETFTIGTTITPSNASVKNLNWKSEDETIASVNSEGTVTCLKEGTTKIRATSPTNTNIYAECVIKVSTIELKNFGLTKSRIYLHLGEEEIIEGKFYPTNASNRNLSFRSSDNSVATVNQNGNVVAKGVGTCNILVTSAALDRDEVCVVEVYEKSANLKTTLSYTYKDYVSNCVFQESCTPSNGDVKALIVPVWFSNSNNFIDVDKRETVRTDIESGFFGSNETVGWRSVRSFYREESRGRFYLDGFVTKWFDCGIKYETFKTNAESTLGLVDVATEWIIRSYPEIDLNEYDSDCDGYIDVFVLVYAAPDYTALRDWNSQNLWAYCSWRQNKPGVNQQVAIALDCAASELYDEQTKLYTFKKALDAKILTKEQATMTTDQLIDYLVDLTKKYPIVSIEDGLAETDWEGFAKLTSLIGNKVQIVGDDLYCTNPNLTQQGLDKKATNAVLIKLNQIGSLTETIKTIQLARSNNWAAVVSHRSGETEDTFIADLSVALNCGQIKTGSMSRSERICKYNRLMEIEDELSLRGSYDGIKTFKNLGGINETR